jgi:DNA-directed RNA polymerase subunit beta'
LKRLEDELSVSDRAQASEINNQIAEIKVARDKAITGLKQQEKEQVARYDELVAEKIEPIIKEGQKLETTIQEKTGKTIRTAIKFSSIPEPVIIAEVGSTIAVDLISKVQQVVKDRIDQIESELKEQKQRDIEALKLQIDAAKAEAETKMESFRNKLDEQSDVSHKANVHLPDGRWISRT